MLVSQGHSNSVRWNIGERMHHPFEQTVDTLVAAGEGTRLAIVTQSGSFSYADLDRRANQTARFLKAQGIKAGDRVGLLLDKSLATFAGLLGTLKAHAAYVPFDASFPADRIAFIAGDSGIETIVTYSCFAEKLSTVGCKLVLLDQVQAEIDSFSGERLSADELAGPSDQLAYVIYTSGSTGNPKGVAIEHPSIVNFIRVAGEVYGIRPDDRIYQGLTIAFDYSIEEIFVPWQVGATVVAGPPDANLLGRDLAHYLIENKISAMCCVPTLLATVDVDVPGLRWLMVSGEACPPDLVKRWVRPGRQMLNAYGPTETTVTCTLGKLEPGKPITIGKPLPTYTIVILDENKDEEVPDGGIGEVGIAGICVARGYVNRDDLTAKAFKDDVLNLPNNTSGKIYRSGDRGRVTADGEVEYLGRIDTQVKIRGYRIELSEIETVIREVPGIAQAVVNPWKQDAGSAPELVAYYTLKDGVKEVQRNEIAAYLRTRLPGYMVPPYMEQLASIPMLPSAKADRKKLPPPQSQRFFSNATEFVAPTNAMEEGISTALAETLGLERVSIKDNFFNDLGAHSLLMAQFATRLKQQMVGVSVSMRDIYQHPTVESLAKLVADAPKHGPAKQAVRDQPAPYVASDFSYYLCGTLQFMFYMTYIGVLAVVFAKGTAWMLATNSLIEAYFRACASAAFTIFLTVFLSVSLKWLLIGKYKPKRIKLWSLEYFRFWAVKTLIYTNPLIFLRATPLYNAYLRLLGAKIGKTAVLNPRYPPVCADMFSIGEGSTIRKDAIALGYRARAGYIEIDHITIGKNVLIGEASIIDIGATIGDDVQLGHVSSVHSGQTLESGKRYYGSPPVETDTNFEVVPAMPCSERRRVLFGVAWLASLVMIYVPIPVLATYYIFPSLFGGSGSLSKGAESLGGLSLATVVTLMFSTQAAFLSAFVIGLVAVTVVPRLLAAPLEKDRVYSIYGLHFYLFQMVGFTSNNYFYNTVFGDSSYITRFLSWIGYDLGQVKQTGSNFGISHRHDVPTFCKVGSGTLVSDGLNLINAPISSTSFRVSECNIGPNNFLGNEMHYPAGARIGTNCLLASKVHVPIDGPLRENVGLLGSPPFEIPRNTVSRKQFDPTADTPEKWAKLKDKNAHNLLTAGYFLFFQWLFIFIVAVLGYWTAAEFASLGIVAVALSAALLQILTVGYFVAVERLGPGFRELEPFDCTIHDRYFWEVERYWKLGESVLKTAYKGTPFRSYIHRLQGAKVGRKVYDDGSIITEKTLVEFGDNVCLNENTTIQSHSLEDGLYKSGMIRICNGATIGLAGYVHYSTTIGENAYLEADSFLMKGSVMEPHSHWQGNPAREVEVPVSRVEPPATAATPVAAAGEPARITVPAASA